MDQLTQAGSSNVTTFLPLKKKRGRPRKDPSLKRVEVSQAPPGYGKTVDFSDGGMVGQPITGVIETAFDAGYMLNNVRIGNSNASFKGVIFKPGHALPLTPLIDVAPNVQMIKRKEILENGTEMNGTMQRHSSQPLDLITPKGGKLALQVSPSSHLNGRGKVVPVVLKPVTTTYTTSDSSDKDVLLAEPLSVLLPFGSSSSSTQFLSSKSDGSRLYEDTTEAEKSTRADVPVTVIHGSSEPSYVHDGKNDSFVAISQLGMDQGISKNNGSGRMTDLLHAMHGNFRPVVDSNVE